MSDVSRFIVLMMLSFFNRFKDDGSWRLVVVKVIQASVQLTSSTLSNKFISGFGVTGSSLQDGRKSKRKNKNKLARRNIREGGIKMFLFFIVPNIIFSYLNIQGYSETIN